jgi:uncharacterized protein (DUF2147 family)
MKRSNHPAEVLALILAATLCAFTPSLAAQSQDNAQQGQQQQTQQQNKTFTGKVTKLQSGQYALVTGQTPEGKLAGHFLDDPDDAKKYEGKQVTVTGTFDEASNTIHVTNIQAA